MERRKQLKEKYKQMKPELGVFMVQLKETEKTYLEGSTNLRSALNRVVFQLKHGSHPQRELQKDWNELGEASFTISILDTLAYDEAKQVKDYAEEVQELALLWREKFTNLYD